jgi:hypothetical protein
MFIPIQKIIKTYFWKKRRNFPLFFWLGGAFILFIIFEIVAFTFFDDYQKGEAPVENHESSVYLSISTPYKESGIPLTIDGYDVLSELSITWSINPHPKELFTTLDINSERLFISLWKEQIENISMREVFERIRTSTKKLKTTTLPSDSLVFDITGQKYDIKLLIEKISILKDISQNTDTNTSFIRPFVVWYALLKSK